MTEAAQALTLKRPLLSSTPHHPGMDSSMTTMEWPEAVASRVSFGYKPYNNKNDSMVSVQLRYDAHERLLLLVDSEEEEDATVIDVIDMDDMIGAAIQVNLCTAVSPPIVATPPQDDDARAANEPATNVLVDRQGAATLELYVYPRSKKATWLQSCGLVSSSLQQRPNPHYRRSETPYETHGNRVAHPRHLVCPPAEDLGDLQILVRALRQLAQPHANPKNKKMLILVNPKSGPKRNGQALAETVVRPLLEQAGMECEIQVTTHGKHAQEIATQLSVFDPKDNNHDDEKYDGLVLVGGDGIVHEALNGIFSRSDARKVLKHLVLGVVGCGTANGFATSLTYEAGEHYGPWDEAFLIAKGNYLPVDVSEYQTLHKTYTSHLTFTWAMIADIDIESERIHWMGETRFDVWAVLRVLFLRRYKGRLSYLPATKGPVAALPPLAQAVPDDWIMVEDDFVLFWASQVSHAAIHTMQSPSSHLQDGVFFLMMVRGNVSRYRVARILLGLESGAHVDMPGAEFVACTAYRLEPLQTGSCNDIDGEVVEDGPVQARVLPRVVQFFGKVKPQATTATPTTTTTTT